MSPNKISDKFGRQTILTYLYHSIPVKAPTSFSVSLSDASMRMFPLKQFRLLGPSTRIENFDLLEGNNELLKKENWMNNVSIEKRCAISFVWFQYLRLIMQSYPPSNDFCSFCSRSQQLASEFHSLERTLAGRTGKKSATLSRFLKSRYPKSALLIQELGTSRSQILKQLPIALLRIRKSLLIYAKGSPMSEPFKFDRLVF